MRISAILLTAIVGVTATSIQAQASWSCSAKGIVDYSFDGTGCATIHLTGYPYGNCYPVTMKGNVANGVTTNGTPFTCRKK
jgi:hypothetical protein